MAIKVHFCKQGYEALIFAPISRWGWYRFDVDLTGAIIKFRTPTNSVGGGSFDFSVNNNFEDLADNNDYVADHSEFLTYLSYNMVRSNTTGRTHVDVLDFELGNPMTIYLSGNWTSTVAATNGVLTDNIPDSGVPFVTTPWKQIVDGTYVYTGSDYSGITVRFTSTLTSESVSGAGLILTRTYDWSLVDIDSSSTLESGTVTETSTISNQLTDATLRTNCQALLDWAEGASLFGLSSGTTSNFKIIGYDNSNSMTYQQDTLLTWMLYKCNPINAGVGTSPKRAIFIAGPAMYLISRYKLEVGADVWCVKIDGTAPTITGTGYLTFNEYGTWLGTPPLLNDGAMLSTTIPGSSVACSDFSQTPCDSTTVQLDEPTTVEAGNSIYGIRYLLPEQSC